MKIIKNMLYIAVVTIALTYFSCNSKLTENKDVKHTQTSNKAANGGTGTPAVQTEEEKLKDDIAKEANCPSTAPTYDYNTFVNLPDNVAKLHWLRCALKTQVAIDALKIATGGQSQQTLLHSAAEKGDLESVKLLVNIVKIGVDAKDNSWGLTALMWAVFNGHLDIVEYLAKPTPGGAGADLNVKNNAHGKTALMWAVENDRLDIVQYLVSAAADVNLKDNGGKTALMWAVENDRLDIVEYLAKPTPDGAGADVTLADNNQKTACDRAAAAGSPHEQAMLTAMHNCQKN